uniref:Phospholipid scramblase n=1 Tax=Meloidogyne hapla TaxID=6305 RepID=A0A1I8BWR1_MELHA
MNSLFFANILNPCCSRSFIQSTIYLNKYILPTTSSFIFKRFYCQQDKPQMYHLEHVQKRLEFTTPLMFKMRMDYTFLRKDVFLDDQIMGVTRSGLFEIMQHFGTIALVGNLIRANIDTQALNIVPILEDGTVRLRWRLVYHNWIDYFSFKSDKENIFYVDGDGLVYKFTLQKTMPDDESSLEKFKGTKDFVKKVVTQNVANYKNKTTN